MSEELIPIAVTMPSGKRAELVVRATERLEVNLISGDVYLADQFIGRVSNAVEIDPRNANLRVRWAFRSVTDPRMFLIEPDELSGDE